MALALKLVEGMVYKSRWYGCPNNGNRKTDSIKNNIKSNCKRKTDLMVNQKAEEIIELHSKAREYTFPWMNEDGKRKVQYLTLE